MTWLYIPDGLAPAVGISSYLSYTSWGWSIFPMPPTAWPLSPAISLDGTQGHEITGMQQQQHGLPGETIYVAPVITHATSGQQRKRKWEALQSCIQPYKVIPIDRPLTLCVPTIIQPIKEQSGPSLDTVNTSLHSTQLTQPLVEPPSLQHAATATGQNEVIPLQLPTKIPDTIGATQHVILGEGMSAPQQQELPIQTAHLLLIRKNVWSQMQVYSWLDDGVLLFPTVHVTDPLCLITSLLLESGTHL